MLMNINDNYELILSSDDFKKMIDLYMGDEAAAYFGDIVASASEAVRAVRSANDKTNSYLSSYEASLESNSAAFFDILDVLKNISDILSSKRINRSKIADYVGEISKIISNQI